MSIPTLDATGKVVVVTGASKGLGRAMALGFAEAGAAVVVASRKLAACEAVAGQRPVFETRINGILADFPAAP